MKAEILIGSPVSRNMNFKGKHPMALDTGVGNVMFWLMLLGNALV